MDRLEDIPQRKIMMAAAICDQFAQSVSDLATPEWKMRLSSANYTRSGNCTKQVLLTMLYTGPDSKVNTCILASVSKCVRWPMPKQPKTENCKKINENKISTGLDLGLAAFEELVSFLSLSSVKSCYRCSWVQGLRNRKGNRLVVFLQCKNRWIP